MGIGEHFCYDDDMKLIVDPTIFERYPDVEIGVLDIHGMDNSGHNNEILSLLRKEEAHQHELLANTELGSLPEIGAWRKIYKSFGSDSHDFLSSVEAVLRRARRGVNPLPQINNLVDLYNYISLKYHMPVGAEDSDKIRGDVRLGFMTGTEKGMALGNDHEEVCDAGEVAYADDAGFLCRRWNWREADRTKIEETTQNAMLVIEKVPALGRETLIEALTETKQLIEKYLHGRCDIVILSKDQTSYGKRT